MSDQKRHDTKTRDMELVNAMKNEIGCGRTLTHIGFLLQELGVWKGHSFNFGNYPRSLQSDGFTEMVYEAANNPYVGKSARPFDATEFPLIQEIESLVRSRQYWYDLFAYLLFCNKYGYPTKNQSKREQAKAVKHKYKNVTTKDINTAWKTLEKYGLMTVEEEVS